MGRFYGKVGYAVSVETRPGVWTDQITERFYYGDVLKLNTRWQNGQGVNDDLTVSHQISIVADPFAYQNFSSIKYVEWMDALWKVNYAEVERPRLLLTLGGVYNGPTPDAP